MARPVGENNSGEVRIAHFSDPHIIYLRHAWHSCRSGKQLLGLVNWILRRRTKHHREIIQKAVRLILADQTDLVLITGDICQLALPRDYAAFGKMLAPLHEAGIPALILPGNHDHYSGREEARRAYCTIRDYLAQGIDCSSGVITYKDLELIFIDAAIATPSFKCYGVLEIEEIERLQKMLAQRESEKRLRLACGHFPLLNAKGEPLAEFMAMQNAAGALTLLQQSKVAAFLCGHIHKPFITELPGGITQYCSGSVTGGGVLRFFSAINGKLIERQTIDNF